MLSPCSQEPAGCRVLLLLLLLLLPFTSGLRVWASTSAASCDAGSYSSYPLRACAIPERFCGGDSLRRGAISSVCTFTCYLLSLGFAFGHPGSDASCDAGSNVVLRSRHKIRLALMGVTDKSCVASASGAPVLNCSEVFYGHKGYMASLYYLLCSARGRVSVITAVLYTSLCRLCCAVYGQHALSA